MNEIMLNGFLDELEKIAIRAEFMGGKRLSTNPLERSVQKRQVAKKVIGARQAREAAKPQTLERTGPRGPSLNLFKAEAIKSRRAARAAASPNYFFSGASA